MMKHDVVEKVVYEENDCVRIMVEKKKIPFNEPMSMIMLIEN